MDDVADQSGPADTASAEAPDTPVQGTESSGDTTGTIVATPNRGRPIIAAIAGLFFGLFVAVDLIAFGVIALESVLVLIIPIVGLAAGIALAMWAPFGSRPD